MRALELFAGAGGLGMGLGLAGFAPLAVVERDKVACDTIRENQERGYPLVKDWPLVEDDVRNLALETLPVELDLVAGGPPCQPFSMGGKHRAQEDARNMFPPTVEIIRRLRPKAFLLENVKGLLRSSFANYYQYILLQLEFPEITRKEKEDWEWHYGRLQAEKISGRMHDGRHLAYNVVPTLVNAADYGVPQRRERVFIVGFRDTLGVEWSFPEKTHSLESLVRDQWVTGEYWERHRIAEKNRPPCPEHIKARAGKTGPGLFAPSLPAWRTVRDALSGLPEPRTDGGEEFFWNHRAQPGARVYKGHTGSPLDLPAKTLKAGDHGVPGGENMLVKPDGEARYFTVRESARIQTFPDGYVFHGSWTETMRQLGNAVPVALARVVAASVAEKLALAGLRAGCKGGAACGRI
jgi:DNA (cytosine-5)-methyltransferase 1